MRNFKFILVMMLFAARLGAGSRIILYLKPAPRNIVKQAINELKKDPSLFESFTPKLSGFLITYAGYMDVSNRDGLISFPLRHVTPKVYVAIAPQINLIAIKENTISHREFLPEHKTETKLYSFEKKEDIDPENPTKKTLYWRIKEAALPQDNKINPLTIVILSKASNFYVPIGDFMSEESVHMVLPNIYVIGNIDQNNILQQILDVRKFFEAIDIEDKKIDDKKTKSLIKNI